MSKTEYLYKRNCDFCGTEIKTNREDQRFCSPPKKCHDLWWARERKEQNTIPRLINKINEIVTDHEKRLKRLERPGQ